MYKYTCLNQRANIDIFQFMNNFFIKKTKKKHFFAQIRGFLTFYH